MSEEIPTGDRIADLIEKADIFHSAVKVLEDRMVEGAKPEEQSARRWVSQALMQAEQVKGYLVAALKVYQEKVE